MAVTRVQYLVRHLKFRDIDSTEASFFLYKISKEGSGVLASRSTEDKTLENSWIWQSRKIKLKVRGNNLITRIFFAGRISKWPCKNFILITLCEVETQCTNNENIGEKLPV
jgi:hypothetical protein